MPYQPVTLTTPAGTKERRPQMTDLTDTQYLKHIVRAAHQGDARRITRNVEQACDAGELTVAECKQLRDWAKVLHRTKVASHKYTETMQAVRAWANTKH